MNEQYKITGAAIIFMVLGVHGWLPTGSQSYLAYLGAAFGLIAGGLLLLYGLIGGRGYFDLSYVQSVRSVEYIADAYLPLTIITNRALAAAVSIPSFWFVHINWHLVRRNILAPFIVYLGLAGRGHRLAGLRHACRRPWHPEFADLRCSLGNPRWPSSASKSKRTFDRSLCLRLETEPQIRFGFFNREFLGVIGRMP